MAYDYLLKVKEVGLLENKVSRSFSANGSTINFRVDVANLSEGATLQIIVEESKDNVTFTPYVMTKVFSEDEQAFYFVAEINDFFRFNFVVATSSETIPASVDIEVNQS